MIDAASADGTAELAERAGAVVHQQDELLPAYGPVLGKGDAMWRALSVLDGELVCFLDADTEGLLRALRHRPARAARVRARGVVRQGLLPAPARRRREPTAAGASTT